MTQPRTICSVPSCEGHTVARSWCHAHWRRWRLYGDPLPEAPIRRHPPMPDRFWAKVRRVGECWEWAGVHRFDNYGQFGIGGQMRLAHRIAWELTNGPIPDGLYVCHHCDNPPCVRPDHLFLGTARDNALDMLAKGRQGYTGSPGEQNHQAKLTASQVRAIRRRYARGGISQRALAQEYGVTQTTIGRAIRGECWSEVA